MLRPLLVLSACVAILAPAVAAAADTHLNQILTPEEFARAGLAKLSPEELAALETALAAHQQIPKNAPPARKTKADTAVSSAASGVSGKAAADFGAEQISKPVAPADMPDELHSRIEGKVREISGRAAFVLENGQIWQQRVPELVVFSKTLENPEVVITHGIGGYKMLIVPANRVILVKRIQ